MSAPVIDLATVTESFPPCPPWCDGTCGEWTDEDGNQYHASPFVAIKGATEHLRGPAAFDVSVTRLDSTVVGATEVHLLAGGEDTPDADYTLTPAQARQLAAALLNAADAALEPQDRDLPTGDLTVGQAARELGVNAQTVRRWTDVGVLPLSRLLPSGHRRYSARSVEELRCKIADGSAPSVLEEIEKAGGVQ